MDEFKRAHQRMFKNGFQETERKERQEALRNTSIMEDDVNHRASRVFPNNSTTTNGSQVQMPPPPPQFASSPPRTQQQQQYNNQIVKAIFSVLVHTYLHTYVCVFLIQQTSVKTTTIKTTTRIKEIAYNTRHSSIN
uniref:Uncharacterized protein n=1 Tax=Ceratitis capitata TaxID=7213 RepID=W8AXK7_CERCA